MNHYIKVDENNYITHYLYCFPKDAPQDFIQVASALNVCELYDANTGTSIPEEQS
jgi:hypothetical protein